MKTTSRRCFLYWRSALYIEWDFGKRIKYSGFYFQFSFHYNIKKMWPSIPKNLFIKDSNFVLYIQWEFGKRIKYSGFYYQFSFHYNIKNMWPSFQKNLFIKDSNCVLSSFYLYKYFIFYKVNIYFIKATITKEQGTRVRAYTKRIEKQVGL